MSLLGHLGILISCPCYKFTEGHFIHYSTTLGHRMVSFVVDISSIQRFVIERSHCNAKYSYYSHTYVCTYSRVCLRQTCLAQTLKCQRVCFSSNLFLIIPISDKYVLIREECYILRGSAHTDSSVTEYRMHYH